MGISEQIVVLQEQQEEIEREFKEVRKRMADMETEAAKELNLQPRIAVNVNTGLEDAVRMLMVAMHTCRQNLPPKLAEAITVVSNYLPIPTDVSEEM